MKPLTNMQLAMNVVIVSIGLSTALWIFSKAVLNLVLAANKWVGALESDERSDNQTNKNYMNLRMRQERIDRCK